MSLSTHRAVSLLTVATWFVAGGDAVQAQPRGRTEPALALQAALVDVIARAERSVISIARVPLADGDRVDPTSPSFVPSDFGSGVVIENRSDPDGRYVLTTYHLVFGGRAPRDGRPDGAEIWVTLPGRQTVRAAYRTQAADNRADLAVLKLDLQEMGLAPDDVPPLRLGRAEDVRKGHLVVALGNPYAQARDGSASASIGIVSNIARRPAPEPTEPMASPEASTIHHYGTLLQLDTRLNLGMSGAAVVNLDGELIGIATSLAALEGYESSVGYAIPLDAGMRRIVEELLEGYEAEYGLLGVQPRTLTTRDLRTLRVPGRPAAAVLAATVANDSPAWQAELRNGDILLEVNDQTVHDEADLLRIIGLLGPGAAARVRFWRPSEQRFHTREVRLTKWPVEDDSRIVATSTRHRPWRGLSVDYSTARRRFLPSDVLTRYRRAVVVTDVQPDSPADVAGLQPGQFIRDVEGTPVDSPRGFLDAVTQKTGPVRLILFDGERVSVP